MPLPLLTTDSRQGPIQTRHRARSKGKYRLAAPIVCLLSSTLLCGCAAGLMSMPGAAMLADRFGSDKDEEKVDDEKDQDSKKSKKSKLEDDDDDFSTSIKTPTLSEYMSVQGNTIITVRGVGLVTGLNGTGGDPSPSALRTQLGNEMSRRNVKDSKQILASQDTALVVVTAYLPAMVTKGQRFDVRVAIPPQAKATSLKGGYLLETRMFEEANVEGRGALKGHEYALAGGAILTNLGVKGSSEERQGELMYGTIPGGAVSRTERDLSIIVRREKKGFRNSKRIADAVSERFNRYNNFGQKIPCAVAKQDDLISLKVHPQYINNFPRYQAVIRSIAFNETEVARRIRVEKLARELMDPEKAQVAALQLEAIGDSGIPFLKDALESTDFEVKFQAAQALAYLGDASGIAILKDAARDQPAFRVYAFVAMSVIDDADSVLALRELMDSSSLETRYGAFRALKELDPHDPWLSPVVFDSRFLMHVIDSPGEAMVHVTRRRSPEVVVFGPEQQLQTPANLNAGRHIKVIGAIGDHEVDVILYKLNEEPKRQRVSNRVVDVIRACGEQGATYPDIVQLLIEAEQQHNFVGQFGIDRMPQAGRMYVTDEKVEDDESSDAESGKQIGSSRLLPEMFDELDEEELRENETEEKLSNLNFDEIQKQDAKSDAKNKSSRLPNSSKPATTTSDVEETSDADVGDRDDNLDSGESDPAEAAEQQDSETEESQASNESRKITEQPEPAAEKSPAEAEIEPFEAEAVDMSAMKGGVAGFGSRMADRLKHPFGGKK
ncbi:MAG: flagellar basal body P-ring protein FlgI [Planctomycetales bacterium]|nr:flagellar basal body P-ring protein FlgI [Planctomycetales bacterium]